ncbi:helix-turn-helix domain-containing protein [Brevibacillus laterosporus]|nr:phBC6A51 family helix-turn-helix protein [Brevibacillus laterosporus]TPG71158.1 helix-turn-helix domain-containing protein [Brevibacillus laterosporus]
MIKLSSLLSAKQHECIRMMLELDIQQKDIAKEIGVTPETISRWKHDESFINEYNRLAKTAYIHLAPEAQKALRRALRSENEDVAFKAAKDVLDRAGHRPAQEISHDFKDNNPFKGLTDEELKEQIKRLEGKNEEQC